MIGARDTGRERDVEVRFFVCSRECIHRRADVERALGFVAEVEVDQTGDEAAGDDEVVGMRIAVYGRERQVAAITLHARLRTADCKVQFIPRQLARENGLGCEAREPIAQQRKCDVGSGPARPRRAKVGQCDVEPSKRRDGGRRRSANSGFAHDVWKDGGKRSDVEENRLAAGACKRRTNLAHARSSVPHDRMFEGHRAPRDVHPAVTAHDETFAVARFDQPVVVDPAARQLRSGDGCYSEMSGDAERARRPRTVVFIVQQFRPPPRQVYEGEYLPPSQRPSSNNTWKGFGAGAIGLGFILAKFKSILLILLSFKWIALLLNTKILFVGLGFFASIWFYALFWGWKFAVVFVLLILIHELGHAALMRFYGVPASLPYFIPGLGAMINMRGRPSSQLEESYIALAGPLTGTLASLACYAYGEATGDRFWIAIAYTGFFLNLFNLFPVLPLDGGRVVGAISPRIWIFGLVAMIVAAFAFHWFNPLMLILIVLSIPQAIAAWRGQVDTAYHDLSAVQRGGVALAYFSLAGFLFAAILATQVAVPR